MSWLLHLRPVDWVRAAFVIAVVGGALAVEMASGQIRQFYGERPLQAGMVTSLLLAAAAFFGVDAIRAQVDDRRWTPLSRLAFISLAFQTTLLIDVALWLVTGRTPVNDAAPTAASARTLRKVRARAGLSRPDEEDLGAVAHADYLTQMRRLLAEPAWVRLAVHELDRAKWRNRDTLAVWTSAMLTTGQTADVLNRLAALNEGISDVQAVLRALQDGADTGSRDRAVGEWMDWHAEAVSLREDLMRAGRGLPAEWRKFRLALPEGHRAALDERDAGVTTQKQARSVLTRPLVPSGRARDP